MGAESRRPVLIYGAGGFGREVASWLQTDPASSLHPIAFIDDASTKIEPEARSGIPVGPLKIIAEKHRGTGVLFALGSGKSRHDAAIRATQAGLFAESFVHSSVIVGERVSIGEGGLILPGTILTCDIRIGRFVVANCSCNIGHDVEIGDYATLMGNNSLNGNVHIGNFATIGSRATIYPGRRIGIRSTVGIGSVVIRSVHDDVTVFGIPAKAL